LRACLRRSVPHYAAVTTESNPPKRRGCFFYGCLSLVVIALLAVVAGIVGFFVVKNTAARWINEYTETTPALVEQLEYPKARMDALNARLAAFKDALDQGRAETELVLTADDLNALIATSPEWRGKVFVRIDDDTITGDVSILLSDIGPLKLKGRYLNGTATLKLALENARLDVRVQGVKVRGKALPAMILARLKKENLAAQIQNDPKVAADIARFESIQVTNSQVILRNKVNGASQ
jgi:hypothetical protein